jgi:hypothetical protein
MLALYIFSSNIFLAAGDGVPEGVAAGAAELGAALVPKFRDQQFCNFSYWRIT